MADDKQDVFLEALEAFVDDVRGMKQFKGKAKVIRSLERIPNLSVFKD